MLRLTVLFAVITAFGCGNELEKFEALVDEVCKCADQECAKSKMDKMLEMGKELHQGKSPAELKRIADQLATIRGRMEACTKDIAKKARESKKEEKEATQ